jgi:lysophospholipase L1-like esterase
MRSILCYGDSNTWGAATVARPDNRYTPNERWPGVLRAALGPEWLVIEEGLGGRTTVSDDPVEWNPDRNGARFLPVCLHTHKPLDVVAIMLGTNDLKARFGKTPWEVAQGVGVLVDLVKMAGAGRNGGTPEIIMMCPPIILDQLPLHPDLFAGAPAKSREIAARYRAVAAEHGVRFFDAASVAVSSKVDGFHLDPEAHTAIGRAIAAEVSKISFKSL